MRSSGWRFVSLAVTFAWFTFSGADRAHAQSFYYSTASSFLIHYDHETQTATTIGQMNNGGNVIVMVDIASDYDGNLFGGGADNILYRIDKTTATITPVANTGVSAIGLVFKPDGTLWAAGNGLGYANSLFKIDPVTGASQHVLSMAVGPSGDISYSPKTGLLYMSAFSAGGDQIVEIDTVTGAYTPKGTFPLGFAYGMDFSGDEEKIIGMSDGTILAMDTISPPLSWYHQISYPGMPGPCNGLTKFHCSSKAIIQLNGVETASANLDCGAPAIVDGSTSQNVKSYEWKISGSNTNGDFKSVTIKGKGIPGSIDLMSDTRLTALEFLKTDQRAGRTFTVELSTWCDPFEPKSTTQLTLHTNAVALLWDITPPGINRPPGVAPLAYVHEYRAGTDIVFKDTGTLLWASGKWSIDAAYRKDGKEYQHQFHSDETGPHTVTYEVTHTNKCVSKETRLLNIIDGLIYVPNAFSPNGDGLNDTFGVHFVPGAHSGDLTQFEFLIYNRWGQQVFKASTPDAVWNGTINGQAQDMGTFFWLLKYKMRDGETELLKGDVSLIR